MKYRQSIVNRILQNGNNDENFALDCSDVCVVNFSNYSSF